MRDSTLHRLPWLTSHPCSPLSKSGRNRAAFLLLPNMPSHCRSAASNVS